MKPEQLIAELEAAQNQGESRDWNSMAPLLREVLNLTQAALERLTTERDEALARNAFLHNETGKALEIIASRIELNPPISADEQSDIEAVARWVKAIGAEQVARLMKERDEARAELARMTTPRPIEEAPRDGTWIVAIWPDVPEFTPELLRWAGSHGWDRKPTNGGHPLTHFFPLPVKP